ncbi:DUF2486 family protein [Burkholderia lata]|uniref:DUF2486 domain-containing protein n=1 Tax=Burkholderia lata (strain ATCC 17760 / DSM 23089 / LMG 22485 / NCIMB 9086 / R18194 / 383) TaxID=482957 RepID=A0A6P2MAT6_BURL3|nr:DUF2486 family protein [Burkholderia lata]VWB82241.1 hypothetical protein BLA6863_03904 [Burkholderia lata]
MTEADSSSIPTLTDVLVPGKPVPARAPAPDAPQPPASAAIPVLTDVVAPHAAGAAPADSAQSGLDPDSVVVERVPTPHVPAVELPGDVATAAAMGETDAPAEPGAAEHVVAEDSAAMSAPLPSSLADDVVPQPAFAAVAHEAVGHAREAHMPEAVMPAAAPQPDAQAAAGLTPEDAQHIAERLRNRLTNYLTGEGRDAIEARCRDALHEHSAWLVGQITREVALALETEVMDWVRDAVDEEVARRRTGHSG